MTASDIPEPAAATAPLLDIRDLAVDFRTDEGDVRAVAGVSLQVAPGEILGLVGESGSGKSVTAKAVMRLNGGNTRYGPDSTLRLNLKRGAVDVLNLQRAQDLRLVRGDAVSMVFQEPMASFAPAITIGSQMVETIRLHRGGTRRQAEARAQHLLERVGIDDPPLRLKQYAAELSGGMRQRAMIALALSTEPRLLIADEPTTAVDVTLQKQILALIRELQRELGMAVLFISHDLGVVANIADRVAVMRAGKVLEHGATGRILSRPEDDYTRRLLDSVLRVETVRSPKTSAPPKPLVEVDRLSVAYRTSGGLLSKRTFTAVEEVSLTVGRGEFVGLVGESGSGKTSIGRAILRAAPISGGAVRFHGDDGPIDVAALRGEPLRAYRSMAQLIFQDPYAALNPRMTVRDIIAEPLVARGLTRNKAETDARVRDIAERCQLNLEHLRRFPHAFSGGQRQRINIARALVCQPKFVVADEAVAALDVSIQGEILDLLLRLQQDLDLSFLFISHDLGVVANTCERVIVLQKGQLVESGPTPQIFTDPQQPYTRKLIDAVPKLGSRQPAA